MAFTILTLYKTDITPERNCRVDSMSLYLHSRTVKETIQNFQYKSIKLDDTIKLNMSQTNTPNFPYNYLDIQRTDDDLKHYYYFILNSTWKSENTVELQISLDTINTFWTNLIWTDRTNITRQHKDRFYKPSTVETGSIVLNRDVDDFDEGINPVKLLVSQVKMNSIQNLDYYLIYRNATISETSTVPIDCYFCASQPLTFHTDSTHGLLDTDIVNSIYFSSYDNGTFTYKHGKVEIEVGQDKTIKAILVEKATNAMVVYGITDSKAANTLIETTSSAILTDINLTGYTIAEKPTQYQYNYHELQTKAHTEGTIYVLGDGYVKPFTEINRTDTQIVKIIKMPYAPFDFEYANGSQYWKVPSGWNFSGNLLKLNGLDEEFLSQVARLRLISDLQVTIPAGDRTTVTNDKVYESKLKNSNFYSWKFYYDNFNKEIMFERTEIDVNATDNVPKVRILFKQSNNLSSNSLFHFTTEGNLTYNEPNLYGEYLNANRQNEVALYNSDYLNYIRSGYNYDKKAKTLQAASGWLGTGLNFVGATGSLLSRTGALGLSGLISFGTSAIQTLSSNIFNTIAAENQLQQKLEQLRLSPASVSNTEDLNLLSYYNGNKLISVKEKCTDEIENQIYNLFRLTGYKCNEYAIPDLNSRTWFNFIQCDADFDESQWSYGQDFLSDLKSRLAIGVTIFHRVNNTYDFNQEKENFESWLTSQS